MHIQFTSRHCLGKQTVLHCLFMNSSVFCRRASDEDIYILLWYGHVFDIINLLSNLPSALPTHRVNLYSYLITCHKTACRSQPSSASFVTFEVCWRFFFFARFFKALRRWDVTCCLVKNHLKQKTYYSEVYRGIVEKNNLNVLHMHQISSSQTKFMHKLAYFLLCICTSVYGMCYSTHRNLHFSPWWEPGINNASGNRWVTVPPIICCLSSSFPHPMY